MNGTLAKEQWSLLAVSDSIDAARSAARKLVPECADVRRSVGTEAICRANAREGMHHLKQLGVRLGAAPWMGDTRRKQTPMDGAFSSKIEEQRGVARIRELYDADEPMRRMCEILTEEGVPCRGTQWYSRTLHSVLQRAESGSVRRKSRHLRRQNATRDS